MKTPHGWLRAASAFTMVAALTACSGSRKAAPPTDPETERPQRAERKLEPLDWIEGEPIYQVLPKDAIPSIDEPVFVSAEEGDRILLPHEPVLGVVGLDGSARAYSAWQLDAHEIVNDVLDGSAIAVTW